MKQTLLPHQAHRSQIDMLLLTMLLLNILCLILFGGLMAFQTQVTIDEPNLDPYNGLDFNHQW